MSNIDVAALKRAEDDILCRYLDQLVVTKPEGAGIAADAPATPRAEHPLLPWLIKISQHYKSHITSAITKLAAGGSTGTSIDWDIAFLTYLENMAVHLRDVKQEEAAAEAHRRGDTERAIQHLRDAAQDINTLANEWGMHYVQLCDLTTARYPTGSGTQMAGPYCGAFYSTEKPMIGISFKGTSKDSDAEFNASINNKLNPEPELWGANVSQGAYYGLIKSFTNNMGIPTVPAYEIIVKGVENLFSKLGTGPIPTHVAGHSLGGSYSTLCFARLLHDYQLPSKPLPERLVLTDLYAYAGPRVGLGDFRDALNTALENHEGRAWRIFSEGDLVPTIPPINTIGRRLFVHIDSTYKILPGQNPVVVPSEIAEDVPIGTVPITEEQWAPHMPGPYMKSLAVPLNGEPLPDHLEYPPLVKFRELI